MTDNRETLEIGESGRLDKRLSERLDASRNQLQQLIENGKATVNNRVVTTKSHTVHAGDRVEFDTESLTRKQRPPEAEDGPLSVLFEDDHILAVNKPSGTIVHPTENTRTGTLVNRILAHYPDQRSFDRAGLVHRLDKGTSGVLLVGRSEPAIDGLKKQFKKRSINKRYRAILDGRLDDSTVKIDVPVGRDPGNPVLRTATPDGKKAVTELHVAATTKTRSAVYCHPISGRTHQIRVHCQYLGHPIVGDEKYNGPEAERLMLHAETIEFNHPVQGRTVTITAELPEEVDNSWQKIRPPSS